MTDLTKTLRERGSRYGSFEMGAIMMQGLKAQMRDAKLEQVEQRQARSS